MINNSKKRVLFVCMGNICRSPTADGVFAAIVQDQAYNDLIECDSAGTHAYHIGSPPDTRAQATARNHGVDLSHLVARKVMPEDFYEFDFIIAMDEDNVNNLRAIQNDLKDEPRASVHLFMEFATNWDNHEVPDPYYGGDKGFEEVFKMISDASKGLVKSILNT